MGLLDRFRAAPTPPADERPRGESGRGNIGGYVREDELNSRLVGVAGLRVFDKMWRSDPDVRGRLLMLINPIVGATWSVDPFGGKAADDRAVEQAAFVRWALLERLMPSFPAHVAEVMRVAGRAGFAPFEQVWAADQHQGRQVLTLDRLELRLPQAVRAWDQDAGRLTSITMNTGTGLGSVTLPAEDLAYYRLGVEGDNWKGESLLRPAYKPWKFKEALELVDSIGHERHHVGVPVVYPPQGAQEPETESVEEAVRNLRANSQGYIIMPGPKQGAGVDKGWLLEILTPGTGAGQTSGIMDSLKYHRDAIAAAMVEEFMRLGQSGVGARATADVQADPFLAFLQAIASMVIEDTVNTQVIPRLVALNFPQSDGLPRLRCAIIDQTALGELASYVKQLSDAGALHPDPPLEEYLRDRADLPPVDPDAQAEREDAAQAAREALTRSPAQPPAEGDGAPQQPPQAAQPPPQPQPQQPPPGRSAQLSLAVDPRTLPSLHHVQVQRVAADHLGSVLDGARGDVEQEAGAAVDRLAQHLAEDPNQDQPAQPPADLVAGARSALRRAYDAGARSVRAELARSAARRTPPPQQLDAPPPEEAARLTALAEVIAGRVLSATWAAIKRAAQLGITGQQLVQVGQQAGLAAARAEAQQAASAALNAGRQAEAASDPDVEGVIYTALMDTNTCDACAAADTGDVLPLDSPDRIEPPNADCEGGGRCRCIEVYVLAGDPDLQQ